MSKANDMQIGGNHYKQGYQHWDWICDITDGMYLFGCATKYVSRWENKNGIEDLKKAVHFLNKMIEREVNPTLHISIRAKAIPYTAQLGDFEIKIIHLIYRNHLCSAIVEIEKKIDELEGKPVTSTCH